MFKSISFAIFIFCLTVLSSETAFAATGGVPNEDLFRARELGKAVNAFAFDLYKEIAKEEKGNIFFSPLSISMALALAYEGAAGETREEMRKVLHFDNDISAQYKAILNIIKNTPPEAGEVLIANAIWPDKNLSARKEYMEKLRKYYDSEAIELDYTDVDQAVSAINNWTNEKTRGEIKEVVTHDDFKDTFLSISNAIYFIAEWQNKFSVRDTMERDFFKKNGDIIKLPTMFKKDKVGYYENEFSQSISLHYKDAVNSMLIILPEKNGLTKIENCLSNAFFDEVVHSLDMTDCKIYLPKYRMQQTYHLVKTLRKLGLERATSLFAEFTKIARNVESFFIDNIIHKTVMEVNEERTKAAAVTVFNLRGTMNWGDKEKQQLEPKIFRADRPFVYMIINNQTKTIMFMGRYMAGS
ncbi:MAG: serpin family protein [Cloacibacillus sp.]